MTGPNRRVRSSRLVPFASIAGPAVIAALYGVAPAAGANMPVAVSGWNQDVVVDTDLASSVTTAFDPVGGNTFYAAGTGNSISGGLPANGLITSAFNSSTSFQLQPYTASNVLFFNTESTGTDNTTGLLSLASPAAYTNISLLAAGTSLTGFTGTLSYSLNYTDGTSSTGTFTVGDWRNTGGTGAAITGVGYVPLSASPFGNFSYVTSAINPRLYEVDIPVPSSSKALTGIQITNFSTTNGAGSSAGIFAVSGQLTPFNFTWTGSASSSFDTTSVNFNGPSGAAAFTNGMLATFDDTSTVNNLTVTGTVAPFAMTFNNNTQNYSFGGTGISGASLLTLNGTGSVTFNNPNTFTGATVLNAGSLIIGSGGSIGSASVTANAGSTFTVAAGGSTTAAFSLVDNGTVNFNQTAQALTGLSGSGNLVLNGTKLGVAGTGNFTGTISGTGSVVLSSASALTGGNSYTGGTTFNNGAAAVNVTSGSFGSGTFTFNGGGFTPAGGLTLSNPYTFGTTNAQFLYARLTGSLELSGPGVLSAAVDTFSISPSITPAPTLLLSGTLSGPGILAKAGTGTVLVTGNDTFTGGVNVSAGALVLSGSNTYTGPTNVTAGTLQIGNVAALGSSSAIKIGTAATSSATLLLPGDSSGLLGLAGGVATGSPLNVTLSGAGSGSIGALHSADNTNTTFAANITIGTGGATISTGANGSLTLTGTISGAAANTMVLTGTGYPTSIILAGANTYAGETQIVGDPASVFNALTVQLAAEGAIPAASGINMPGIAPGYTAVDLNGHNTSTAYLTGNAEYESGFTNITSSTTAATLTIANGNLASGAAASFGGTIGGPVSIVKTGTGNQIFTGANSYTGSTTISGGTLTATNTAAFGSGNVNLAGGNLVLSGAPGNLSGFGSMIVNGGASVTATTLTLTDGGGGEARSAFTTSPELIKPATGFTASFTYTATGLADGVTFTIQNDPRGATAVGAGGGSFGYGGITNSAAIQLDLYDQTVGFGTNGSINANVIPTTAGATQFSFYDPLLVTLSYNGTSQMLNETIYDTKYTAANGTATFSYPLNLNSILGGNYGYVGFTGGDGSAASVQKISNFTFTNGNLAGPLNIANNVITTAGTTSSIKAPVSVGQTSVSVGSLTLASNSTLTVVGTPSDGSTSHLTLIVSGFSNDGTATSSTGKLDLTNSSLVVQNGSIAYISSQLQQGYNQGSWTGPGITSSAAAADSKHLTALGSMVNDQGGASLYTAANPFDGAVPGAADVLVKLTYYGDTNLDGVVDGSDYSRIDNGYANQLTGWFNGDFNYDGVVDGSDYALIDNASNNQGAPMTSAAIPQVAATAAIVATAVPEPASLVSLALAAMLLGRRGIKSRD